MGHSWLYTIFAVLTGFLAACLSAGSTYFIDAGGRFGYRNKPVALTIGLIVWLLCSFMVLSWPKRG